MEPGVKWVEVAQGWRRGARALALRGQGRPEGEGDDGVVGPGRLAAAEAAGWPVRRVSLQGLLRAAVPGRGRAGCGGGPSRDGSASATGPSRRDG